MLNNKITNVIVTGGAGFIGKSLVNKLLSTNYYRVFNIDKLSYSSDLEGIEVPILNSYLNDNEKIYNLLKLDLCDKEILKEQVMRIKPTIIFNLAAETHVDRSIDSPKIFLESNIIGTFNLLEASLAYWKNLSLEKKNSFRLIHISTDEVYGSLSENGFFNEFSRYDPRSPYSASKASSDHLVRAWNYTYGLPTLITNCSNNFGPWQFPEKFIPLAVNKALEKKSIPIYGDGKNIRDWLYVEDHIDALLLVMKKGIVGESYCIGGFSEKKNIDVVLEICNIMDELRPISFKYSNLINFVEDRPGHDYRYAIDSSKIINELNWSPKYDFSKALRKTVEWYISNPKWCQSVMNKTGYKGQRLGSKK